MINCVNSSRSSCDNSFRRAANRSSVPIFYDAANALASTDVVSAWTRNNVAWAAAEGILTKTQTTNTTKNATRAEVATAIYTYLTKTAK